MRLLAPFLAALALLGCGLVYKIDVQQGNHVTQDLVAKLNKGMTKAEVRQLLGTPLLIDAFHPNRWDYYFSNEMRGKSEARTRLSVFFENDKVVNVMGEARPDVPAPGSPTVKTPPKAVPAQSPAASPTVPAPAGK